MAVVAGILRDKISIETCTLVNLNPATGPGKVDSWDLLLTTWGSLKKSGGNRGLEQGEIVENNRYTLKLRYRASLYNALHNDAVAKVRIIHSDGRKFTVVEWDHDKKKEWIKFTLNEQR
jgi:head-tail adaptor